MLLFPESGPKKTIRVNGFNKTVTLHLRSIGPNVQWHMAYFAVATSSKPGQSNQRKDACKWTRPGPEETSEQKVLMQTLGSAGGLLPQRPSRPSSPWAGMLVPYERVRELVEAGLRSHTKRQHLPVSIAPTLHPLLSCARA
jgi:hypothetical protein